MKSKLFHALVLCAVAAIFSSCPRNTFVLVFQNNTKNFTIDRYKLKNVATGDMFVDETFGDPIAAGAERRIRLNVGEAGDADGITVFSSNDAEEAFVSAESVPGGFHRGDEVGVILTEDEEGIPRLDVDASKAEVGNEV